MTAGPATGRLCVKVDDSRCTGLGMCESFAPDVFEVGDDGSLTLLQPEVDADRRGEMIQAVEGCPTEALSLVEG